MTEPVLKRVRKIRKIVLRFPYNNFTYGDLRGWAAYGKDIYGDDCWRWDITHRNIDKTNLIYMLDIHGGIEDTEDEAVKKVEFGLKFIHEHRHKIFRWSRRDDPRGAVGDTVEAQDAKGRLVVIRCYVPGSQYPGLERGKEVVKYTKGEARVLKKRYKSYQSAMLAVKL